MKDDLLRSIRANNPGPFTLDGTRTWIVGQTHVVVIDPGPDMDDHVRAVSLAVHAAQRVTILLTHGHGDHSGGVDGLMDLLPNAELRGNGHPACRPVEEDEPIASDGGPLFVVKTPGHTRDHLCVHWPDARTLFAADMVLGQGDTTWVAEYPGCVADYLDSLDRLEALNLETVYSAHGPMISDVPAVWERYRAHRLSRIGSARRALEMEGLAPGEARDVRILDRLLDRIYRDTIPEGLRGAASASLSAVLEYIDTHP